MAFNWWDTYYSYAIGLKIRGQIGKNYVYYVVRGKQLKRRYNVQHNLSHPNVIRTNENFRKAMNAWRALSGPEQQTWKKRDQYSPTMSGYNYFLSKYLRRYFS